MTLILALLGLALQGGQVPSGQEGSDIVAVINDEAITRTMVDERLRQRGFDPAQASPEDRLATLREIVEEKLFLQEARRLNLTVPDREIDQEIAGRTEDLGGENRLEDYLRISRVTREQYREKIKEVLLVFKMVRALNQEWIAGHETGLPMYQYVTPEEIREYYTEHGDEFEAIDEATAEQIVLTFATPEEREEKRRILDSVIRRIEAGTEFFIAAQLYSDLFRADPRPQSIRLEISGASPHPNPDVHRLLMRELSPNQLSPPMEIGGAWYLFHLVGRRSQGAMGYEEAYDLISEYLRIRRWEENRKFVRAELLRRAYLEPRDLFEGED